MAYIYFKQVIFMGHSLSEPRGHKSGHVNPNHIVVKYTLIVLRQGYLFY